MTAPVRPPRSPAAPRAARRAGMAAMAQHLLLDGPPPANPFHKRTKSAVYFDWGADQLRRLVEPLLEPRP